jgi:hypothetical protein
MNHICHAASHIKEIHLMISKGFWNLAHWRHGDRSVAEGVLIKDCLDTKNFPNFLTKIAKISAPAPRWRCHDRKWERDDYDPEQDSHYSSHGTNLHITIDGADSGERQAFVRELEEIVEKMREARPLFRWGSIILALLWNEPFIDVERRIITVLLRFGFDGVGMNEARFMIVGYPFFQSVMYGAL